MAFGLQTQRKASVENVLKTQKILPKKRQIFLKNTLKLSIHISPYIIFILTLYWGILNVENFIHSEQMIKVNAFKIQFQGQFSNETKDKINKNTESIFQIHKYQFDSILEIAETIHKNEGLAEVHAYLDFNHFLSLSISPRIPILFLGNKENMISLDGEIYKDSNFNPKYQTVLLDLFEKDTPLQIRKDHCIAISQDERNTVLQVIKLLEHAERHALAFTTIHYIKYRGFLAETENNSVSIIFGFPPFDKQFTRLDKILEDAKKRNQLLSHIEVDYPDKAFTTESRL